MALIAEKKSMRVFVIMASSDDDATVCRMLEKRLFNLPRLPDTVSLVGKQIVPS